MEFNGIVTTVKSAFIAVGKFLRERFRIIMPIAREKVSNATSVENRERLKSKLAEATSSESREKMRSVATKAASRVRKSALTKSLLAGIRTFISKVFSLMLTYPKRSLVTGVVILVILIFPRSSTSAETTTFPQIEGDPDFVQVQFGTEIRIPDEWFTDSKTATDYESFLDASIQGALFAAHKYRDNKHTQFNPRVSLQIYVDPSPELDRTGADFIEVQRSEIRRLGLDARYPNAVESIEIDGIPFHRLRYEILLDGIMLLQRTMCFTVQEGHILMLEGQTNEPAELNTMNGIIESVTFARSFGKGFPSELPGIGAIPEGFLNKRFAEDIEKEFKSLMAMYCVSTDAVEMKGLVQQMETYGKEVLPYLDEQYLELGALVKELDGIRTRQSMNGPTRQESGNRIETYDSHQGRLEDFYLREIKPIEDSMELFMQQQETFKKIYFSIADRNS
jgi:hypothetical protein